MASDNGLLPLPTRWSETVSKTCPWPEYPRPQLRREHWQCLNGVWEYAIREGAPGGMPAAFDGNILTPFSPESLLSGVGRQLLPGQTLWYRRRVRFENTAALPVTLLHFGAVDQCCAVYLNGQCAGRHEGGYWPFALDVSHLLREGENEIALAVTDDTNQGSQAYGKQSPRRGGIWYTAQSGIWQTVWAEFLPQAHVETLRLNPLYDESCLEVTAAFSAPVGEVQLRVLAEGKEIAGGTFDPTAPMRIPLPGFRPWDTEDPFLYDLELRAGEERVQSYFGMRKFGTNKGSDGVPRFTLNGRPIFQTGLLDQGYWSDGLYTPPCEEAVVWELEQCKALGFNMLRKHIKIEPLRWYYHCDRLGLLVWQDLVSGGAPYSPFVTQVSGFCGPRLADDRRYARFGRADAAGRANFERDMHRTLALLGNVTSLALWVPFNEAWGQFDSVRIAEAIRAADPSRWIDHASGWHDQHAGDCRSRHVYFIPYRHKRDRFGRVEILSEFGGYSCPAPGHMASRKRFGYKKYDSKAALTQAYARLFQREILPAVRRGLSAAVYTQVSDVEDEINGLFTYDRAILKPGADEIRACNKSLLQALCDTK
ncbi:MAG: glycoside hydrolase family 2 [Oscillospiraceae bacterium]|jgi:hypothetical protein|nr:glycoside hydrolase family 2 [Oscillospiraceae bacterium]